MKIAILGWGSLIWQPKNLDFDKELNWNSGGPYLPLEFSRISEDGRLTLVIDSKAKEVQTLFSVSTHSILEDAISNLAVREGSNVNRIGYYEKSNDTFSPINFTWQKQIKKWIDQTDIDAVIWTNLSKKFKDKINLSHSEENVIKYLESLSENKKVLAEEYIRKAPQQIQTTMRKKIEKILGWTAI